MANLDLVQVLNTCQNLVEETTGFTVLEPSLLDDVVKEFATARILHDEEELLRRFNYFVELHDIWVSHDFQNVDFSHDARDIRLVLNLVLLEDLDGDLLLRQLVDPLSHLPERARADRLPCKQSISHVKYCPILRI